MVQKNVQHFFIVLLITLFFLGFNVQAGHNASRYFPFLERPENYLSRKRPYFHVGVFHTTAAVAFKRGGGTAGIPELWGKYNLNDVIFSVQEVLGSKFTNPILSQFGSDEFTKQDIIFNVGGKVKTGGVILNYEHDFKWHGLSAGVWLPVMYVSSTSRFVFDRNNFLSNIKRTLSPSELMALDKKVDRARRLTHEVLGFQDNAWQEGGIGDLDLHARWSYFADHKLLMKSIRFNAQLGLLFPTSKRSDFNVPSSIPFMGGGHWGLYLDVLPEFELKQDVKLGILLSYMYQFDRTKNLRIPVYKEPAIFSALVGPTSIDRGDTWKISPYVIFENLVDGLHFHARYTYLKHAKDVWKDSRKNSTVSSYLTRKPDESITQENIKDNIRRQLNLTRWRSHYVTLQLSYESKEALKNWKFTPNLYVMYDIPVSGNGICKTHQFTVGVEIHF